MAGRNIQEYIGLSRKVITNKLYTSLSSQGNTISFKHKFKGLLEESIFKWIFNDGKTPTPHPYSIDNNNDSIYELAPHVTIAIAADWASDTVQSEKIGELMGKHGPDYTIHLGDTYYSGSADETHANFTGNRWPLGKTASFALLGNHEMYSGAFSYFDTLLPSLKQANPFFCLKNDHWCVLGLDTGYQSIIGGPSNNNLHFQDEMMNWLSNTVKLSEEKRGIIVFTHHQYISAFGDETVYLNPAWQLQDFFEDDREIIWIWGHEHRFSMYGKYKEPNGPNGLRYVTAHGRCIGNGGMPDEHTAKKKVDTSLAKKYKLVLWDFRVADEMPAYLFWKIQIGANGYSLLDLDQEKLTINYYSSYTNDENLTPVEELIVTEIWEADNKTGAIKCIGTIDNTAANGTSKLTFADGKSISDIG